MPGEVIKLGDVANVCVFFLDTENKLDVQQNDTTRRRVLAALNYTVYESCISKLLFA